MSNLKRTMVGLLVVLIGFTVPVSADESELPGQETGAENMEFQTTDQDGTGTKEDETEVTSGVCGENITWHLEEDGTLILEGSGEMSDYGWDEGLRAPWSSAVDRIYSVIIEEGIQSIGRCAFYQCTALQSVILPQSLEKIGNMAFFGNAFSEINLPDGICELGSGVFRECANLRNIELPENITIVRAGLFDRCSSLEKAVLPEGITQIERYAFFWCENLRFVNIPENVTSIGLQAFQGCENLRSLHLSSTLALIEQDALADCGSLRRLKVSEGLDDLYYTGIGLYTTYEGGGTFYHVRTDGFYLVGYPISSVEAYARRGGFPFYAIREDTDLVYTDVEPEDWFLSAVHFVDDYEYMTGLTPSVFGPAEKLSRAQFATVLHRMDGYPAAEATAVFPDTESDSWYSEPVSWANREGIITGYADGTFGPADYITREQVAAMLYRYAAVCGYDISARAELDVYPDAKDVSGWAEEAMRWAVGSGILTGKDGGKYLDPSGSASRAECAAMVERFIEGISA